MELGKLALYILGIPTNFAVDKNIITEKITLNDENFWPIELKWWYRDNLMDKYTLNLGV